MSRLTKYYNLNTKLSYISNDKLKILLASSKPEEKGWGNNKIIEIDNIKIFCKKIPVANLFAKKPFETTNLYDLPMHYNYGIGSAGFSPWRELLLHIKITNYVLNNEIDNFPLLYHYRVIEEDAGEIDTERIEKGIQRWNNNQNIKKYLEDRELATMHIIMCFEHIEYNLSDALTLQKISYENSLSQALPIIKFLNKNGILHMDSHPYNYLVDGFGKLYLADFGISIDREFNLSESEITFMENNSTYDYALTLQMLSFRRDEYEKMKQNGFNKRNFIEKLNEIKILLEMDDYRYRKILEYKDILDGYNNFILEIIDSPNKETVVYPNDKIKRLLILLGGNYKQKYIKYCDKIKSVNNNGIMFGGDKYDKIQKKFIKFIEKQLGGKRHKHILLFGVSSVGKSTIARMFETKGYTRISVDDYWLNEIPKHKALIEIEKNVMTINQYTPNRQDYRFGKKGFFTFVYKMMYNDAINKDVVYDTFSQEMVNLYKNREDIFTIHVYASPYKIIDNILRRRFVEPRDRGVFQNFRSTYISTTDDDQDYIDIINRRTFIDALKEKLKHEFNSEEDLIMTANEIFEKMGITDDNDHKIKLRENIKYDYLVKIENESIDDIMRALVQFTE